jgi:hypothetical protein
VGIGIDASDVGVKSPTMHFEFKSSKSLHPTRMKEWRGLKIGNASLI